MPQLIVPDNPKALIARPDRYEPQPNDTVQDFASHYGTSVLPARPRHPQDKAKVESAVQVVERWILMRLRHQRFGSLQEVNAAIAPLLEQLNAKPFQKLPGSRATAFAELDAPALMPLPLQPWEFATYKTVRVHIDCHIEFDAHRYSVPQALVGQQLQARVTARSVERILHERRHPEHGYRACLGLLSLAKRYGKPRLEAACELALELGTTRLQHIHDILGNGRDRAAAVATPDWSSPLHEHVRGPGYYQ